MDSFKVRTGAQDMQKVKGRLLTEHLNLKLTAWRGRSIPTVNSDKAISSHSEKNQDPENAKPEIASTIYINGYWPYSIPFKSHAFPSTCNPAQSSSPTSTRTLLGLHQLFSRSYN